MTHKCKNITLHRYIYNNYYIFDNNDVDTQSNNN